MSGGIEIEGVAGHEDLGTEVLEYGESRRSGRTGDTGGTGGDDLERLDFFLDDGEGGH